jgi:hypothetical protein
MTSILPTRSRPASRALLPLLDQVTGGRSPLLVTVGSPILAAALVGMLGVDTATAQRFAELGQRNLPFDRSESEQIAFADVDGDGDLDAFTVTYGGLNRLLENDGTGVFTDATTTRLPGVPTGFYLDVEFADLDADGDLDAFVSAGGSFVGGPGGQNRLLLNDGTGVFTDATATNLPPDSEFSWELVLGDVDNDGDLDAFCANFGSQNRLYLNDGSAVFSDVTGTNLPSDSDSSRAADLADVDGDGDLDLAIGSELDFFTNTGSAQLLLNDGTGVFVQSTTFPQDTEDNTAVRFVDVDLDGDADLVIGNDQDPTFVYANDGTGTFTDVTATAIPNNPGIPTLDLIVVDVDNDGDSDLVRASASSFRGGPGLNVLINDGAGVFTLDASGIVPPLQSSALGLSVADVDGDGDVDLALANSSAERDRLLFFDQSSQTFVDDGTRTPLAPATNRLEDVAAGDIDSDGDTDLVVARFLEQSFVYRNDGFGRFDLDLGAIPAGEDRTLAVALGDVDGDGDLDAVLGVEALVPGTGGDRVLINDGTGNFTDETGLRLPAPTESTTDIELADIDGDGDLDLIAATSFDFFAGELPTRLYRNNGNGVFTSVPANIPSIGVSTSQLAVADVDGDNDLDLVLANTRGNFGSMVSQQTLLFRNDGTGVFTDESSTAMPADNDFSEGLALADVDGDGDLDLAIANDDFTGAIQNRLYVNDGTGVFTDETATRLPAVADETTGIAFLDADGDGDQDLVLAQNGSATEILLNDGFGVFGAAPADLTFDDFDFSIGVVTGDFDDDRDVDILVLNEFDGPPRLYANLATQQNVPFRSHVGDSFAYEIFVRPNQPGDSVIAYFSTGTGLLSFALFGDLRLDPNALFPLGTAAVGNDGVASITGPLPNDPALVDLPGFAQSIVVLTGAGLPRLTNATVSVIRGD